MHFRGVLFTTTGQLYCDILQEARFVINKSEKFLGGLIFSGLFSSRTMDFDEESPHPEVRTAGKVVGKYCPQNQPCASAHH